MPLLVTGEDLSAAVHKIGPINLLSEGGAHWAPHLPQDSEAMVTRGEGLGGPAPKDIKTINSCYGRLIYFSGAAVHKVPTFL